MSSFNVTGLSLASDIESDAFLGNLIELRGVVSPSNATPTEIIWSLTEPIIDPNPVAPDLSDDKGCNVEVRSLDIC